MINDLRSSGQRREFSCAAKSGETRPFFMNEREIGVHVKILVLEEKESK